jgi:hypothetical protein
MFASPWDAHPFAEYSQPMRIPLATRSERIDPIVKLLTHEYSYTITVSAPSGFELGEVKGSALDQCSLVVVGSLVEPATTYEYVSKCQARVYGSPHGRCLLGVLPAGTVFRGGPPSHSGWIALEDDGEDAWVLDDGNLAIVSLGRPAQGHRFSKHIALPPDALPRQATVKEVDNSWFMTIPRRRKPPGAPRSLPSVAEQPVASRHTSLRPVAPAQAPHAASSTKPHPSVPQPAAEQEAPAATRSVARAPEAAKAKKKTRVSPESVTPNLYDVLQSTAEPLLHECTADQANVQTPIECSQEWQAVKGGGFVRTA